MSNYGLYSPWEIVQGNRVDNATLGRSMLTANPFDPKKDIDADCGYPKTASITTDNYKDFYDRMAIATRVVEVLPDESWLVQPLVFEDKDPETETEFEKAWEALGKNLTAQGWFESKEKNPIWEYLHRVDVLSGIGSFGVFLLGVNEGSDLAGPMRFNTKKERRMLFLGFL